MLNHCLLMFPLKRQFTSSSCKYIMTILLPYKPQKCSLKKLVLDICTKTAFSSYMNEKMGSSLGPVMVIIIMTKTEKAITKPIMNNSTIKFCCWYVDGILLVVNRQGVNLIHNLRLCLTVDFFGNEALYFLRVFTWWNFNLLERHKYWFICKLYKFCTTRSITK